MYAHYGSFEVEAYRVTEHEVGADIRPPDSTPANREWVFHELQPVVVRSEIRLLATWALSPVKSIAAEGYQGYPVPVPPRRS